jgi:hypothetical protein
MSVMDDGASYKQTYDKLLNSPKTTIEDNKEQVINTINKFLKEYPKSLDPAPNAPWVDLPVRSLVSTSLQTAIDVINDLSTIISNKDTYSATEYRRQIVNIFFRKDRRLYIGFWIIFISIILYFIDSSA